MTDENTLALAFTQALATRDYGLAYSMTSRSYRQSTPLEQMQEAFETIVPLDWGTVGPIKIGLTMTSWPDQQLTDRLWVYVSIGGDVYSEGITAIVMEEKEELRIRAIEWGRP